MDNNDFTRLIIDLYYQEQCDFDQMFSISRKKSFEAKHYWLIYAFALIKNNVSIIREKILLKENYFHNNQDILKKEHIESLTSIALPNFKQHLSLNHIKKEDLDSNFRYVYDHICYLYGENSLTVDNINEIDSKLIIYSPNLKQCIEECFSALNQSKKLQIVDGILFNLSSSYRTNEALNAIINTQKDILFNFNTKQLQKIIPHIFDNENFHTYLNDVLKNQSINYCFQLGVICASLDKLDSIILFMDQVNYSENYQYFCLGVLAVNNIGDHNQAKIIREKAKAINNFMMLEKRLEESNKIKNNKNITKKKI